MILKNGLALFVGNFWGNHKTKPLFTKGIFPENPWIPDQPLLGIYVSAQLKIQAPKLEKATVWRGIPCVCSGQTRGGDCSLVVITGVGGRQKTHKNKSSLPVGEGHLKVM